MTADESYVQYYYNQDYEKILQECVEKGVLFEDNHFPADNSSISKTEGFFRGPIEWRRPWEISEDPQLFVDGLSIHDVAQGEVGNCWLISAMGSIACHPNYLQRLIPNAAEQAACLSSEEKRYGIFRFRIWRFGYWTEVVIDDRLPTREGRLIFAHSSVQNEFWCALLEKAYAKINRTYEALVGGQEEEGLVDLSGGLPECFYSLFKDYNTPEKQEPLFKILEREFKSQSIVCASIGNTHGQGMETKLSNGLVTTHAYTITMTKEFISSDKVTKIRLLKLRNPWGHREWNGAYSDHSEVWNTVPEDVKREVALVPVDDGEFWMPFEDFMKFFDTVTITRLLENPPNLELSMPSWNPLKSNAHWYQCQARGVWSLVTRQQSMVFANPDKVKQYYFTVETDKIGSKTEIVLHVLQRMARPWRCTMGVLLGRVDYNRLTPVYKREYQTLFDFQVSGSRSICFRRSISPGAYVVIPCLMEEAPDKEPVEYYLRIWSPSKIQGKFLEAVPAKVKARTNYKWLNLCDYVDKSAIFPSPSPSLSTVEAASASVPTEEEKCLISRVVIRNGVFVPCNSTDGLTFQCTLQCEDQIMKTSISKGGKEPTWEEGFLIYRKHPEEVPILIEVVKCSPGEPEVIGKLELIYAGKEMVPLGEIVQKKIVPISDAWEKLDLSLTMHSSYKSHKF